jgi:hypothetical protein
VHSLGSLLQIKENQIHPMHTPVPLQRQASMNRTDWSANCASRSSVCASVSQSPQLVQQEPWITAAR